MSTRCAELDDGDSHASEHTSDSPSSGKRRPLFNRVRYYIPSVEWLPRYRLTDLWGDVLAGLTVAFMLIPQGLSYASLAGLEPKFGLYTAFFPLIIFPFLSTSRYDDDDDDDDVTP